MAVGSGICKGLGVTVAWVIGREGSVQEVGLGGLGEGQWWGGNYLLKKPKSGAGVRVESAGEQAKRYEGAKRSNGQTMETTEWDG